MSHPDSLSAWAWKAWLASNPPDGLDIPGSTTLLSAFHSLVHIQLRLGWANEFTVPKKPEHVVKRGKTTLEERAKKGEGLEEQNLNDQVLPE